MYAPLVSIKVSFVCFPFFMALVAHAISLAVPAPHAPAAVAHSKVPPASKSNIERLWKTIEAKRRGSLVDFNTGLQNETGGVAAHLSLNGWMAAHL